MKGDLQGAKLFERDSRSRDYQILSIKSSVLLLSPSLYEDNNILLKTCRSCDSLEDLLAIPSDLKGSSPRLL